MAVTNRLRGKSISFEVDGTEYNCDAGRIELTNEVAEAGDGDYLTFCDVSGTSDTSVAWTLTVEALQSTDAESLWTFVWDNAGTQADFVFAPHGNAVASVAQPHFTGTIEVGTPPAVGGEANTTWVFEKAFEVVGSVNKVES